MVTLITYPLQVPNAPVALIEVGDFQAALLKKYLGEEVLPADLENDVEEVEQLQEPISPIVPWEQNRSVPDSSEQKSPEQDALWIYKNLAPNAHAILDQLVNTWRNEGDEGFVHGQVLARSLNLEPPQFRGSLASFEIRAKAVSRPNPVRFERGEYGGRYSLAVDAAPAFETAQRVDQSDKRHHITMQAAHAAHDRYREAEGEVQELKQDIEHWADRTELTDLTGTEAAVERTVLNARLQFAEKELDGLHGESEARDGEMSEAWDAMDKIHDETGI